MTKKYLSREKRKDMKLMKEYIQQYGIAIEKGFQEGGKILREKGLHVESLAIIDSLQGGNIITR